MEKVHSPVQYSIFFTSKELLIWFLCWTWCWCQQVWTCFLVWSCDKSCQYEDVLPVLRELEKLSCNNLNSLCYEDTVVWMSKFMTGNRLQSVKFCRKPLHIHSNRNRKFWNFPCSQSCQCDNCWFCFLLLFFNYSNWQKNQVKKKKQLNPPLKTRMQS